MTFRKYTLRDWDSPRWGICFEADRQQPTLDLYLGRTILVWFRRKF